MSAPLAAADRSVLDLIEHMGRKFDGLYPSYDEGTGDLLHWCAVTKSRGIRRGHVAPTPQEAVTAAHRFLFPATPQPEDAP